MGCDPTGRVACQKEQNLQVSSLDTSNKNRHAAQEGIGCYTQDIVHVMLLKPVCNA